jgi:hypothetical protein
MTDLEMEAMLSVNTALKDLEPEAARRVLRWAADRYAKPDEVFEAPPIAQQQQQQPIANGVVPSTAPETYDHIAELVSQADPRTDVERALVGTYWFQICKGEQFVTAQQVNTELRQLGYHVKNITDAFSGLISRKPQYALQMGKSGTSRQARKKYKLTDAGVKQVRQMIHGSRAANGDED